MKRLLPFAVALALAVALAVWWATDEGARPPTSAPAGAPAGAPEEVPEDAPARSVTAERSAQAARVAAEPANVAPASPQPRATGAEQEDAHSALVVRVLDAEGEPLADVAVSPYLVRHRDERQRALLQQRTGPGGLTRWPLEADLLRVGDELSMFVHPRGDELLGVTWSGSFSGEPIEVRLARAGVLEGRAVFAETGEPVLDGRIAVRWMLSAQAGGACTTPVTDGEFRAEGVVGEIASIGLIRAGFQYVSVEPFGLAVASGGRTRFDVAFSQGPVLALRVVDADTLAPLLGARVRARTGPAGVTDGEGRLALHGVFATGDGRVQADLECADYEPRRELFEAADALPGGERVVELRRGSVVSGVVVDPAGVPLSGVTVLGRRLELYGIGGNRRHVFERSVTTDAAGRFRLAGLPSCADFDLVVLDGRQPRAYLRLRLPADAGERVVTVPHAAALAGDVVDAEGAPVPQHTVFAFHPYSGAAADAETDASGRFELAGLHPGEWTLVATWGEPLTWGGSYTYHRRVVQPATVAAGGAGWVRLRLPADAPAPTERLTLRCLVTDAATGAPLRRAEWFQVVGVDSNLSVGLSGPVLEDGALEYELPAGVHTISIRAVGYALFREDVELRAGAEPPVLHVRLVPERP